MEKRKHISQTNFEGRFLPFLWGLVTKHVRTESIAGVPGQWSTSWEHHGITYWHTDSKRRQSVSTRRTICTVNGCSLDFRGAEETSQAPWRQSHWALWPCVLKTHKHTGKCLEIYSERCLLRPGWHPEYLHIRSNRCTGRHALLILGGKLKLYCLGLKIARCTEITTKNQNWALCFPEKWDPPPQRQYRSEN